MEQLKALTSLRFFAAAMVVVFHCSGFLGVPKSLPQYVNFGGAGVSIFFVLSGFILTINYPDLPDWASVRRFWRNRFARLWPAHMAVTLWSLWFAWPHISHGVETAAHIALNATMTMVWLPLNWPQLSYNGPAWSVSTEWGFYALFPLLIVAFDRTWWWKLALTFMLVIVLAAIVAHFKIPHGGQAGRLTAQWVLLYTFPGARLFEFVCGMTTAMFWMYYRDRFEFGVAVATALEIAAVAALAYSISVSSWGDIGTPMAFWWNVNARVTLPSAALIFLLALERGLISKALCFRPLVLGGEISYAIYLVHVPLLQQYGSRHSWLIEAYPTWLLSAGYFTALVLISTLIYLCIERPMRALLTGRRPGRGTPAYVG